MKAVLNKVKPFIFPLAIAVIIYLLMRFFLFSDMFRLRPWNPPYQKIALFWGIEFIFP